MRIITGSRPLERANRFCQLKVLLIHGTSVVSDNGRTGFASVPFAVCR